MHRTLPDGTVFFLDTFGLTRLTPDHKVKTIPQAVATPAKPLALGGEPPTLLVPWLYTYRSKVLDADTLKPISSQKSAPRTMLPDGRLLRSYGYGPEHFRITDDPKAAGATPPVFRQAMWDEARALPAIALPEGPSEEATYSAYCMPVMHGDRLLFVLEHQLAAGTIRGESASLEWRAPLEARDRSLMQGFADDDGIVLVRFAPIEQRGWVLRLGWDGAPRGPVVELSMMDLAAHDEGRLVYQRDADTVVVRTLAGGEERTYSIAAATEAARGKAKKGKALGFANAGAGKVIAGAGRLLFVPWHRESFLDLIAEEEVPRKLKAAEAKVRASLTKWLVDRRAEVLEGGFLDVISMNVSKGSIGLTFWSWISRPEQAVPLSCVTAVAEKNRLKVASYGSEG